MNDQELEESLALAKHNSPEIQELTEGDVTALANLNIPVYMEVARGE